MRIPLLLLWLLISTSNLVAQVLVTGQVTDDTGERLIGASILELGTTNGTITDVDGRFALSVPNTATRLRFSYVGTQEKTVTVRTGKVSAGGKEVTLQVRLSLISSQLAEVVVTGYSGTLERKDLVGSYDAVRAEDLELDRPVESIDKLLTGQIAGLNVVNTTGEPGLPVQVQLRGQSSLPQITGSNISASNQPLFVLDGVPLFDVTEQNTDGSVFSDLNSQRLNPLAFLNPEDIESITVLKDASATALYGADAANGVILITTKSGTQEARIQLNYNQGFANTINEVQFLNTEQYVELARETLFNSGRNPAEAGTTDVTTDWRELVQRTSTNRDLDLSFSGKTYRISAGYNQLESIHQGNGSEQFNWSAKINAPLGQRFEVSTRVTGSYQLRQGLSSFDVFSFPPNLPVRLPDGEFNNDGFFDRRANPAALLEQNDNETKSWNWNTNANIKYNPSEQLQFRFLVGLDQLSSRQFQYKSALNGSGSTQNG
ncbi:MAG: TonB-dependent receptor plug domain-containing protein, partial [Bacteroidota bacterium]